MEAIIRTLAALCLSICVTHYHRIAAAASGGCTSASCEYVALQALHNATSGFQWHQPWDMSSWQHSCNLSGVKCNGNGNVTELQLGGRGLRGTLPSSLGTLSHLTTFNVLNNSLNGTLPSEYGQWTQLQTFTVGYNQLSGTLPPEYGAWSLNGFDVSANNFSGTLPPGYGNWTGLLGFYAQANNLKGTLPEEYRAWSSITAFAVAQNQLSGILPSSYGAWTKLQLLYVAINSLTGTLPLSYANMTQLHNIDVGRNRISGSLPSEYQHLTLLRNISVTQNQITGPLPAAYVNLTQLQKMDCSYNQLTGTLPPGYGNLSSLQGLFINNNSIRGTLPAEYASMRSLQSFNGAENQLNGTLPFEYQQLGNLQEFTCFSNFLEGTIPSEYSSLSNLTIFMADNNRLSGTLPSNFSSSWPVIQQFRADNNTLEGTLPPEYSSWSQLSVFSFTHNRLTGIVPQQYCGWTSVTKIGLGFNGISGTLPNCLQQEQWRQLTLFDVASNNMTGTIPDALVSLPMIQYLLLSRNQFSGTFPTKVSSSLIVADLQNNSQLAGPAGALFVTQCGTEVCATVAECCLPDSVIVQLSGMRGDSALNLILPYVTTPTKSCNSLAPARGGSATTVSKTYRVWNNAPSLEVSRAVDSSVATLMGVAALGGLLVGDTVISDGQAFVMLAQSVCAPASLQQSTSTAKSIMVSPFASLGAAAIVLGNGGIISCAVLVVHVLTRKVELSAPTPPRRWMSAQDSSAPHDNTRGRATSVNVATNLIVFLLPGIVFAIPAAIGNIANSSKDDAAAVPLGSASVVCGIIVLVASAHLWYTLTTTFARKFTFTEYTQKQVRHALPTYPFFQSRAVLLMRWGLLPEGAWGPQRLRECLGKMRVVVLRGKERFALYPTSLAAVCGLLTGLPVPGSWCSGLMVLVAASALSGVALILVCRPNRSRAAGLLHVVALFMTCVSAVLCAVATERPGEWELAALPAVSVLSSVVSVIRVMYGIAVAVFESRIRSRQCNEATPAVCTTLTLPLESPRRQAKIVSVSERLRDVIHMICQATANSEH